jgi:hypothetical protein
MLALIALGLSRTTIPAAFRTRTSAWIQAFSDWMT